MLLIKKEFHNRKINWFLLFYFTLGIALVMSRSSIIGIVVSTAIIFFILRRRRFYQFTFSLIFLVLIFVLYEPFNEAISLFLRIEEGMSTRDYIWTMSLNMIRDYPVFGIGPGGYKYEMFNYFPFMLDSWYGKLYIYFNEITGGANLSHNIFLVFFTEMGIPGFLTIIALPVVFVRIGFKTMKKYKNESAEKYYLIIALFAAGISIIVRNFFNSIGLLYVGGIHTDLPFWLIFGSLVYFYQAPLADNSEMKDQHKIHN
jgi:O-antigen ligase